MSPLPEIPAEAYDAASRAFWEQNDSLDAALTAAWPHLYAAALRHAATLCEYDSMAGFDCLTPDGIEEIAAEAERQ